jgi:FAD/FMN-containing dehydrogenase
MEIPDFEGVAVWPGDADYDATRAIWNAMHDRRPAVIARCATPQDVAAAIRHGRDRELAIAVRSGGHSMPGFSTCDGGIVIDLRPMDGVAIDPVARVATVGGGALLGDVDTAAQAHGLVVPAGVISHTGVAGLTLGGGVGRLMRRYGLTIDSLLAVELVTADGELLRASAGEHPDLFWAVRGGGGNFGVVTQFTFALQPMGDLVILGAFHALADAPAVLALARERMADAGAPDALLWTSFLRRAPAEPPWMPAGVVGTPGLLSLVEWSGEDADEGRRVLEEIRRALPPGVASGLDVIPFLQMQRAGDDVFGHGLRTYIKATFVDELTDDVIAAVLAHGPALGSPVSQVEFLALRGAIARVAPDATAFPHRTAGWLLNVPASWTDPADDAREIAWVRDTYKSIEPHATGGAYVNFMEADETAPATVAYGATLERLAEVKARYDPHNVFRLNQNIRPAAPAPAG